MNILEDTLENLAGAILGRNKSPFEALRDRFHFFYDAVKNLHKTSERAHQGHGLDHDVTVAMLCVRLAGGDTQLARKGFCAGLLHSVDRMVDYKQEGLVGKTIRELAKWLPSYLFSNGEVEEIYQAALRHGELNQDDQSPTQILLMDADRLANLQPAVVIRAGQLYASKVPAFEFEYLEGKRNPATTYKEPRSVLDDLRNNIAEYVPKLRVPAAIELAKEYVAKLEKSYRDLGLVGISL